VAEKVPKLKCRKIEGWQWAVAGPAWFALVAWAS